MNRYVHVRLVQLAQDLLCRNTHLLEARLMSQLLMARDRARSNRFACTQEALALVLGVRRAGVSLTAGSLRRRGMIRYLRGDIHVLDLSALRDNACPCYAAGRKIYAGLLGLGGAPE